MATRAEPRPDDYDAVVPAPPRTIGWARQRPPQAPFRVDSWRDRIQLIGRDAAWYALHRPYLAQGIGLLLVGLFVVYILSHVFTGRVFPNVWAAGVNLGEMTVEEAKNALRAAWSSDVRIQLVDDERTWTVSPQDLGMEIDTEATVAAARGVGMAGMPLGYSVMPVVNLDLFVAQNYLLDLTAEANFAAANAGYRWDGDTLVGVPGREGRVLDVGRTVENLRTDLSGVAHRRQLALVMGLLTPEIVDPEPYLEQARAVTSQPFTLTGYDPFRDVYLTWSTDRDTFTSWIEAGTDGLALREGEFSAFLEAQNSTLNPDSEVDVRYLEPTETMERVERAIRSGSARADLRIRYHQRRYEIESGDTGYRIARREGIPFYDLTMANPGVDWDRLQVGDIITLPSRDITLPYDLVPGKRIVVDLDAQYLMAFENGQKIFEWYISSGIEDFPTSPGIFQILTHTETAFGSTFELCGSSGCGQWTMYWFMGIYEAVPGLMNGFHGAVLLPNGYYLGDGNVGFPYTYGCIMSENDEAQQLYAWADQGTVVEIISSDYPPESDLARQMLAALNSRNSNA